MFPHPCPSRHARDHVHVDTQRPWALVRPLSSSRAGSTSAQAGAGNCICVCVCVCVLSVSASVSVSACAPAPASRLPCLPTYTCGACSLHLQLQCPRAAHAQVGFFLSTGPPCPPRRCISVPSLPVGYSTDRLHNYMCLGWGFLLCNAVCVYITRSSCALSCLSMCLCLCSCLCLCLQPVRHPHTSPSPSPSSLIWHSCSSSYSSRSHQSHMSMQQPSCPIPSPFIYRCPACLD